jgi:hypothetical protein
MVSTSFFSRLRTTLWISTSWALMRQGAFSLSTDPSTRARFLSSSATTFLATAAILGSNPEESTAALMGSKKKAKNVGNNPRYMDRELEMKYGEDKSKLPISLVLFVSVFCAFFRSNLTTNLSYNRTLAFMFTPYLDGNPRTRGMLVRRFTGDSTPYEFPVKPVSLVQTWPEKAPFKPEDFFRADQSADTSFYMVPKLVYHIDEPAVASLTQYYRNTIKDGSDVLDICSSWVSHYPLEFPDTMGKISATGISTLELQFNDQLTGGYKQADLNAETKIPYPDNSFDVVTCVVSIDYLIDPITVLKEAHRVLRKGGKVILSQSNRCFPTKAIAMWLKMNDRQHLELINGYFQYAGGFEPRKAYDITATLPDNGYRDPMFIIEAIKS